MLGTVRDVELPKLIAYIGEMRAREIATLARRPSGFGIAQAAFDAYREAARGFPGMLGAESDFRTAIELLMEQFPETETLHSREG